MSLNNPSLQTSTETPTVDCSCPSCQNLCRRNPGWMTPAEAMAAMDAGLARRLMRDWLEPSFQLANDERIYLLAPASQGCEGADAPEMEGGFMALFTGFSKGCCTFLSEAGLCELHDSGFKPLQCRLALGCRDCSDTCPDNYEMAKHWNNEEGRAALGRWQSIIST